MWRNIGCGQVPFLMLWKCSGSTERTTDIVFFSYEEATWSWRGFLRKWIMEQGFRLHHEWRENLGISSRLWSQNPWPFTSEKKSEVRSFDKILFSALWLSATCTFKSLICRSDFFFSISEWLERTQDPHPFMRPGIQMLFPVSIGFKFLSAQPAANKDILKIKTNNISYDKSYRNADRVRIRVHVDEWSGTSNNMFHTEDNVYGDSV